MVSRFFGGKKQATSNNRQVVVNEVQQSAATPENPISELPSSSVLMRTPGPPISNKKIIENQTSSLPPTVPRQNLKKLAANSTINQQNLNVDPQKLLAELQQTTQQQGPNNNTYDEKPIKPMPQQIHDQNYEQPLLSKQTKIPNTRQSTQNSKKQQEVTYPNSYPSKNQAAIPGTNVQTKDYFGVKQNRVKKQDGTKQYTFPEQQTTLQTNSKGQKEKSANDIHFQKEFNANRQETEGSEFVQTGDFGSQRPSSNDQERKQNQQNSNELPQQNKTNIQTKKINSSRSQYNTSPTPSQKTVQEPRTQSDGTAAYNTNKNTIRGSATRKGWQNSGVSPSRNQNPSGYLGSATTNNSLQAQNQQQRQQQAQATNTNRQTGTLLIGLQQQENQVQFLDVNLPRIEFRIEIGQLSQMVKLLSQVAEVKQNHLTLELKEQVNDTLWMLTKVFKESSFGLDHIFCPQGISCEQILQSLNATLKSFNKAEEQITQDTLKLFVLYLQRLDNEQKKIELEDLQNSNCLKEGLFLCLDKSETRTKLTSHLTLKILTQISFAFPTEIRRDLIRKIFGFCESNDDVEAQEHGIKLLCNLLTNEKSCTEVFSLSQPPNTPSAKQASYSHSPLIQAIYACFGLQCTPNCLKFALGATLNLTLLREDLRDQYSELLMRSGGLKVILQAIQTTFKKNEADATLFGLKAVQNLLKYRKPLVKIVAAKELALVDTILNLQKQMYQIVIKSTPQEAAKTEKAKAVKRRNVTLRSSIQCLIELLNLVAVTEVKSSISESLARSSQFLQFCNRLVLVSVDKPAETYKFAMVPSLKLIEQLVSKSALISESILGWEQGELGSNIVSLMESTDQDAVLAAGLKVFQAALESGHSMDAEWISRLNDLFSGPAAQNQYAPEVYQAYVDVQGLSKKKDIPQRQIDRSKDEITWQEQEVLDLYRQAIQDITLKAESQNLVDPSPLRRRIPKAVVLQEKHGKTQFLKQDLEMDDQVVATCGIRDDQSMVSDTMTVDTRFTAITKHQNVLGTEIDEPQILDQVSISKHKGIHLKGQRENASNTQKIATKRQAIKQFSKNSSTTNNPDSVNQQSTNLYTNKLSRNALNALDQSSVNPPVSGTGPVYNETRSGVQTGNNSRTGLLNPYQLSKVSDEDVRSMATDLKGGSVRALSMVGGRENTKRATQSVTGRAENLKESSHHYSEPQSGLKYQVESRSRSLIKGGGNQGGGHRTSRGSLGKDRQKTFEEHVDNFNQLDPLLKGQTLDYSQSHRSNKNSHNLSSSQYRSKNKAISHLTSAKTKNATGEHVPSMPQKERHPVGQNHRSIPHKNKNKPFITPNANASVFEYEQRSSLSPGRSIERSSVEDQSGVGLEQADYYSKPDSRGTPGTTLAVHLQNFGLKSSQSQASSNSFNNNNPIKKVRYEPLKFASDLHNGLSSGDEQENELIGEELLQDAMKIKKEAEEMSQISQGQHSDRPLVTREYQQPTFESYLQDKQQIGDNSHASQKNSNQQTINPFPSLDANDDSNANLLAATSQQSQMHSLQHQRSGPNLYLPLPSVREEVDENEHYLPPQPQLAKKNNLRQFSSRQELQPITSHEKLLDTSDATYPQSGSQTQLEKPRTLEEMVQQNQKIIAERSLKKTSKIETAQNVTKEKKSTFKIQQFKGQELETVTKFIDINLLDKDSFEARSARFQLGIGMPEVRALNKRTGCVSFRDQMNWFDKKCAMVGPQKAQAEVQSAVCSSMFTHKLISLYLLSAQKIGHPLAQHFP